MEYFLMDLEKENGVFSFFVAHLTICCWKVYLICISRLLDTFNFFLHLL